MEGMRAKLQERLAAGFGPGGVHTLFGLGLLASLKGLALVLMAEAVARGVVGVIEADTAAWQFAIVLGVAAGLLRAATAWATESFATRAALGAKESLRHELAERVLTGSDARSGASTAIATVGLDELDNYFRVVLPAIVTTATIPLLVGARILSVDWVSALIIVLTVPLVPVFMILVGGHTRERAEAASASLERLSDHLVELARGLPVLVGLGRVAEQSKALRSISAENRTLFSSSLPRSRSRLSPSSSVCGSWMASSPSRSASSPSCSRPSVSRPSVSSGRRSTRPRTDSPLCAAPARSSMRHGPVNIARARAASASSTSPLRMRVAPSPQ